MGIQNNKGYKAITTFLLLGIQIGIQYFWIDFLLVFDSRIVGQGLLNCINMSIYAILLYVWVRNKSIIGFFMIFGIALCVFPFLGSFINKQTDFIFYRMRYHFIDQPMLFILLVVFDHQTFFGKHSNSKKERYAEEVEINE